MKKTFKPRRLAWTLCGALVICAAAFRLSAAPAGELTGPWRYWRYSRAISLTETTEPRMVSVVPPHEVVARAQEQLADVRVIDEQTREVPYVIFTRTGSTTHVARQTRLLENSFTPGRSTQVILEVGEKSPFHNAVTIETPETDFMIWVEVAVSDDARTEWRIVRERAGIFRLNKQGLEGDQSVSYSDSNARYVRLRFLDGEKRFRVNGAQVAYDVTEPAERAAVEVAFVLEQTSSASVSIWRADLGTTHLPVSELRFEIPQAEFNRSIRISTSADGENWRDEFTDKIYRVRQKDQVEELLAAEFPEIQGMRYWRVQMENGNDPPLAGARLTLFTTPRHVIFRQEPGRNYRLLYGQSEAKPPLYELARLANRKDVENAAPATLASEEVNSAYADPRPWTEQHPSVLWVALGMAVVLLGYSAIRALRAA